MKICLIGHGKMGLEIEETAKSKGHEIALVIHENNLVDFTVENLRKCDVAIEFTTPESAIMNYKLCFDAGIPVVSGTTGWLDHWVELIELCKNKDATFFYASNFSLGVNIFFRINEMLATYMNQYVQYDVSMEEAHHAQKLDSPSGTAKTLAEQIISRVDRKKSWVTDEDCPTESIPIHVIRKDNIPGIHTITWNSPVDTIRIYHSARSRAGFAEGALLAAEFIIGKKGVFSMNDLLNF